MDLRIIGGIYKNRAIKLPRNFNARPTLVRARKIIFDTIFPYMIENWSFLDVFAGSGVMGIEALSRGADKVFFFEIDRLLCENIKKNIINMEKIRGLYSVFNINALKPYDGQPVNIMFLDPPYDVTDIIPDVIKKLHNKNWIDQNTILVIEYHKKHKKKDKIWYEFLNNFSTFKKSRISDSIIEFLIHKNHI